MRIHKKILTNFLVSINSVAFAANSSRPNDNYGARNFANTMIYVANGIQLFGVALTFFGLVELGISYSSDDANARTNGLKKLVIGLGCLSAKGIFSVIGWI